jgi:hypothetical protein
MPKDPIAPLIVANEKEKSRSWDDLETPSKLASWFQKVFAVDLGILKQQFNLFVGPDEPKGGNRGKVHIKTSRPIAVGLYVQGGYEYVYQYPPNVPLQFPSDDIPNEITELTSSELSFYNLTNGDNFVWGWLKV